MANESLLQKLVDTGQVAAGSGGILNAEQANRFIDYMWDATVLVKNARTFRMTADTVDIDRIHVGERIVKKATEGVDTGENEDPTFTKLSLTTVKLRLDWELTSEALEDNIAGDDLEDHVARLMATQFGNDVEDLAINGDDTSSDSLLSAFDGWLQRALDNGIVVDAAGGDLDKGVFNDTLKAMPRRYLQRRSSLRWYSSAGLIQDYLFGLTDRTTALGDAIIFGNPSGAEGGGGPTTIRPYGIPLVEVPLFPETLDGDYSGATGDHGYVQLTFPENFILGIKREIKVLSEYINKKDTVEYTVFTRVGVNLDGAEGMGSSPSSVVTTKNVKVQA